MFWKRKTDRQDIFAALEPLLAGQTATVGGIVIDKGHVLVTLEIDPDEHEQMKQIAAQAEKIVQDVKGVESVRVILTAEKKPPAGLPVMQPKPEARAVAPHVRHIIAVASGKGGVGKSTVATNLAVALRLQGLKVGLLDADVYGPSVPMLMGVRAHKPAQEHEYLQPVEAHGLKVMSMGFLVDEAAPMVWRGPMVQSALLQMLRDVRWGSAQEPLDVLVIDMPPGTGDTQLTIAQKVNLAGAVIVSTPQDVALLDTVKGVHMFQKVSVPILGIIENMSMFCCPHCGTETPVFGAHGARRRAGELQVPFLGEIPLALEIREASDQGTPVVLHETQPAARVFRAIAQQVWEMLENKNGQRPAPRIVIEAAS